MKIIYKMVKTYECRSGLLQKCDLSIIRYQSANIISEHHIQSTNYTRCCSGLIVFLIPKHKIRWTVFWNAAVYRSFINLTSISEIQFIVKCNSAQHIDDRYSHTESLANTVYVSFVSFRRRIVLRTVAAAVVLYIQHTQLWNIHNCETYTVVKNTQLWLVKIKSRQHSKVKIKPEKLYKSCYYYYCYYYYYSTQRVQNDASAKPLNVSPATCDLWHFASKLLCYNGHLPCACQLWVKWLRYFEISHQTEFLWSILA